MPEYYYRLSLYQAQYPRYPRPYSTHRGSKLFPYKAELFSEETLRAVKETRSHRAVSLDGSGEKSICCNNPNLNLVKVNAYAEFDQIPSIYSQDIERKRYFDNNQGP